MEVRDYQKKGISISVEIQDDMNCSSHCFKIQQVCRKLNKTPRTREIYVRVLTKDLKQTVSSKWRFGVESIHGGPRRSERRLCPCHPTGRSNSGLDQPHTITYRTILTCSRGRWQLVWNTKISEGTFVHLNVFSKLLVFLSLHASLFVATSGYHSPCTTPCSKAIKTYSLVNEPTTRSPWYCWGFVDRCFMSAHAN